VPELVEKYGYMARSILHLTKGKEYVVCAVVCTTRGASTYPAIEYLIRDDLDSVSNYNAMLFEITDTSLGNCDWHLRVKEEMGFVLGYDKLVNDEDYYSDVIDREGKPYHTFKEWCKRIESKQSSS
jgi:hypothetical protein